MEDNIGNIQQIMEDFARRDKQQKLERFRRLNKLAKKGQILFCGSSLMEQFPINELLMDMSLPLTVYNRGVGGFTTAELQEALEPCIFELEPRHIFINIGTNDLNSPDCTIEALMGRYQGILDSIRSRLPGAGLHLLAYYPMNEAIAQRDPGMAEICKYRSNVRIREANRAVEALARRNGAEFLDLNGGITDGAGDMKAEYAIEGMHMYPDGYWQVLMSMREALVEAAAQGLRPQDLNHP